jgi:D-serine/D-alanine/glycine transporter
VRRRPGRAERYRRFQAEMNHPVGDDAATAVAS